MIYNSTKQLIDNEKKQVLELFIKNAPFDGWTQKNLISSCILLNYSPNYHQIIFPNGTKDLAILYTELTNSELIKEFISNKEKLKGLTQTIQFLLETKIKIHSKNKEAIRSLIQYYLKPTNLFFTKKELWKSSDYMWHLAGDKSTDYNYFTKRVILSGIYSSTLLFWLEDDSIEFSETKEFISKQLVNIGKFSKIKGTTKNFIKNLKFN